MGRRKLLGVMVMFTLPIGGWALGRPGGSERGRRSGGGANAAALQQVARQCTNPQATTTSQAAPRSWAHAQLGGRGRGPGPKVRWV